MDRHSPRHRSAKLLFKSSKTRKFLWCKSKQFLSKAIKQQRMFHVSITNNAIWICFEWGPSCVRYSPKFNITFAYRQLTSGNQISIFRAPYSLIKHVAGRAWYNSVRENLRRQCSASVIKPACDGLVKNTMRTKWQLLSRSERLVISRTALRRNGAAAKSNPRINFDFQTGLSLTDPKVCAVNPHEQNRELSRCYRAIPPAGRFVWVESLRCNNLIRLWGLNKKYVHPRAGPAVLTWHN